MIVVSFDGRVTPYAYVRRHPIACTTPTISRLTPRELLALIYNSTNFVFQNSLAGRPPSSISDPREHNLGNPRPLHESKTNQLSLNLTLPNRSDHLLNPDRHHLTASKALVTGMLPTPKTAAPTQRYTVL